MAKQFSKTGIQTGLDIEAHHVTQSVDAFTGIDAYDVTLSGSLTVTGSATFVNSITGSSPLATLYGPTAAQILSGGEVELKGTDITLDASGDIFLDADGGNIAFKDGGTLRYNFLTDSTPTLSITGDFTLSGSQDLTFDAAGSNITFKSGSNLRYNFLLDTTPTLSVTGGDFTITGSDDIILNSAGNEIALEVPTGSGYISFADYSASSKDFKVYPYQTATTMSATDQSLLIEAVGEMTLSKTGTGPMTLKTEGVGHNIVLNSGKNTINYVQTGSGQFIISDQTINNHLVISPTQTPSFTAGFGGLEFYTTQAVTGIITLSSSADIILDADGSQIYMKDGGVDRLTFNLDSTPELDVTGDFTIDSSGDIALSADGDQITMDDGTTTRFTFNLDSTPELDVVGNFKIDSSGDIALSADGDQITMDDGTTTRFTFNLDTTPELDVVGDFKIDGTGDIELEGTDILLDASGDIILDPSGHVNVTGSNLWVGPTQGGATELGVYAVSGNVGGSFSKIAAFGREGGGAPGDGVGRMLLYNTGSGKVAALTAQIGGGSDSFLSGGGLAIGSSYQYSASITSYLLELDTDSAGKPTSNTWTITSDERLKTNIVTASLDICYDGIKNIPLKRFGYVEGFTKEPLYDEHKIGWIAQDVEAVFPKAVTTSSFTTWSTYTGSVPITGSAVGPEGETTTLYPGERYQDPLAGSVVIEDKKSLDSDQLMKMMFGAIQKLQEKVEALEAQISGSN